MCFVDRVRASCVMRFCQDGTQRETESLETLRWKKTSSARIQAIAFFCLIFRTFPAVGLARCVRFSSLTFSFSRPRPHCRRSVFPRVGSLAFVMVRARASPGPVFVKMENREEENMGIHIWTCTGLACIKAVAFFCSTSCIRLVVGLAPCVWFSS